jgi:hypothetical protein
MARHGGIFGAYTNAELRQMSRSGRRTARSVPTRSSFNRQHPRTAQGRFRRK